MTITAKQQKSKKRAQPEPVVATEEQEAPPSDYYEYVEEVPSNCETGVIYTDEAGNQYYYEQVGEDEIEEPDAIEIDSAPAEDDDEVAWLVGEAPEDQDEEEFDFE